MPAAAGPLAEAPPAAPHPAIVSQPKPNAGRENQEEEGAPPRRSGIVPVTYLVKIVYECFSFMTPKSIHIVEIYFS